MKIKFSTHWKGSKQPRKQRKYRANAPLHLRKKFVSVNLSKELRKKEGKRNIVARKGDKVKIFSGKFKGKTGKILEINLKRSKIIVEEMNVKKQDGSKANVKLEPSNLQIIELSDSRAKKKTETNKNEKLKEEQRSSGEFKKNSEEVKKVEEKKVKEDKKEKENSKDKIKNKEQDSEQVQVKSSKNREQENKK
jgi:large subunit ribosomal protein L24